MKHAALPDPALAEAVPALAPAGPAPDAPLLRPRLLWRAAKAGARLYRREAHLRAAAPGLDARCGPRAVIAKLAEMEAVWDARRRAHAPDYAVRRHVLVLAALLAERAALAA
ncbi:DUF6477 family protein [Albimonas pacifica]|uniref:Uncharacterized protein n=1 Tax=Albimonas pacifica TaxID=1114924 RepID=A0A1I3PKZ2_9RHOB|nr:DUF6477 family protein [Albimonas pacifica]SFJ22001.1 hypothetical protein SAMN05216258_11810 [Albimonas pacifica]